MRLATEEYTILLNEAKKWFKEPLEKTIFSIGGRGHYENPTSDILAFFMDPYEEHGLGRLVLDSFLECIPEVNKQFDLIFPPEREIATSEQKRIDILLVSKDSAIIIENKIFHDAVNPFKEYKEFVETRHSLEPYCVLLSIKKERIEGWTNVLYTNFISTIKKNWGYCLSAKNPKWPILLREFILNLEDQIGGEMMDENAVKFVEKNYEGIINLINMKEQYFKHIINKVVNEVLPNENNPYCYVNRWDKETALRFYCKSNWLEDSNITIVIKDDGKFNVVYYIYGCTDSEKKEHAEKHFAANNQKVWEEQKYIKCFSVIDEFSTLDQTIDKFRVILGKFETFFRSPPKHSL